MKLHERLFSEEKWRKYDLPKAWVPGERRSYWTRDARERWEDDNEYSWEAVEALIALDDFIHEIRSALICARCFMYEAADLAPVVRSRHDWKAELGKFEYEDWIQEWNRTEPFRMAARHSQFFLLDVMVRMHAYVERVYNFAGLLYGYPADKKDMIRGAYGRVVPKWKASPIRRALSDLWKRKAYQKWVSQHRNIWVHEIDHYHDDVLPVEIYDDLDGLYRQLVGLHKLLWSELDNTVQEYGNQEPTAAQRLVEDDEVPF